MSKIDYDLKESQITLNKEQVESIRNEIITKDRVDISLELYRNMEETIARLRPFERFVRNLFMSTNYIYPFEHAYIMGWSHCQIIDRNETEILIRFRIDNRHIKEENNAIEWRD